MATGAELKQGNVTVNVLTELVYNQVGYRLLIGQSVQSIVDEMDRCARLLLSTDIDGDGRIDHRDLSSWDPLFQKDHLRQGWDSVLSCIQAVHEGDSLVSFSITMLSGVIGSVDTPGHLRDVAVSGGYAYIADKDCLNRPSTRILRPSLLKPPNCGNRPQFENCRIQLELSYTQAGALLTQPAILDTLNRLFRTIIRCKDNPFPPHRTVP